MASDWFREEMVNRQKAEELYRKIDANKRLGPKGQVDQLIQFTIQGMSSSSKRRTNPSGLDQPK